MSPAGVAVVVGGGGGDGDGVAVSKRFFYPATLSGSLFAFVFVDELVGGVGVGVVLVLMLVSLALFVGVSLRAARFSLGGVCVFRPLLSSACWLLCRSCTLLCFPPRPTTAC